MANGMRNFYEDVRYRQVQFLDKDDNRTLEERLKTLPVIRDEDLDEWCEWAER
jgi:hypothetical protein